MGRSTALRSALKTGFYPTLLARGFAIDKSAQPLFTTFRRQVGDRMQILDIQWDKGGTPRFVLNFGDAPAHGVVREGESVPPHRIEAHDCQPMLRLQRRRGRTLASWFQLRKPVWLQITSLSREYRPTEVVEAVVAAFPEVEAWWATRVAGPHVHGLKT